MSAAGVATTAASTRRGVAVLAWLQLLVAGVGALGAAVGAAAAAAAGVPVGLVVVLVLVAVVDAWIAGTAVRELRSHGR